MQTATRGGMLHLVLKLCREFEDAFAKCVDGGKGGGEVILQVCFIVGLCAPHCLNVRISLGACMWTYM